MIAYKQKSFATFANQIRLITMKQNFISNVRNLRFTKQMYVKGEDYFTVSSKYKAALLIVFAIIIIPLTVYNFFEYSTLSEMIAHTYAYYIVFAIVLSFLLISLYGKCISIEKDILRAWEGYFSYKEYKLTDVVSVEQSNIELHESSVVYLVYADQTVEKINISGIDKADVAKMIEKIKRAVSAKGEEPLIYVPEDTVKQKVKEFGGVVGLQLLAGLLKIVVVLIFAGVIIFLFKNLGNITYYINATLEFLNASFNLEIPTIDLSSLTRKDVKRIVMVLILIVFGIFKIMSRKKKQ